MTFPTVIYLELIAYIFHYLTIKSFLSSRFLPQALCSVSYSFPKTAYRNSNGSFHYTFCFSCLSCSPWSDFYGRSLFYQSTKSWNRRIFTRKYYESMRQQHFEIRRLKHDLLNHLHTISFLPTDERETYIADLLKSPALVQRMDYCGDYTVNAVLSVKEQLMRQQDITSSLKLDIPGELPFDKADICVLFANALDNAMESCLALFYSCG